VSSAGVAKMSEKSFFKELVKELEGIDKMDIVPKYPPCIDNILTELRAGKNQPHSARFLLVTFLLSKRLTAKEILKVFASSPDFQEDTTRYQINHIIENKYHRPGCTTIKMNGLCPNENCSWVIRRRG
jgi:DNA primase large subunit